MMNRKNIEDINPLVPVQQGMLYETIRAPGSGIHIEQSMYTLVGKLEITAFERAWQWGIDRHSILRTGFLWKEHAEPLQVTLRQIHVAPKYQDLRGLSPEEQRVRIKDYFREERARGFELSRPPLMRLTLLQIDEQTSCLIWTFHHILMDGWSFQILLSEIVSYYTALSQGQAFHLKPSRPYSDYIRWLRAQDVSQAEQFWRNTLRGFTQPTMPGRVAQDSAAGMAQERYRTMSAHLLPASETAALQMLARRHHMTLSTILQGVWAILLCRYSGTADVVFGVTVSGRSADVIDIETMVGLYMNTLPLRIQLQDNLSLWSWLETLQRQNIEMCTFEYSSAGQIHQWSDMPGTSLLYESILVVENYPTASAAPGNVGISIVDSTAQGAQTKYMVTLMVAGEAQLDISCVYDTFRLEHASIEHILEHFRLVLSTVAAGRDVPLATLNSLIPGEQIPVVYPPQTIIQTKADSSYDNVYSPIEEIVASVWSEVLGEHNQLDRGSNFFEFGGHSLLATQVTSRLRTVLGIELPLRAIFEAPTIAGFAQQVEQALRRGEGTVLPPLVAGERPETLPLSYAQQRLWFLEQLEPGRAVYLVPAALSISGAIDTHALERSMQTLILRHESLRTTFADIGGEPVQVIQPAGRSHLPIIDLQGLAQAQQVEEKQRLIDQESERPCDLVQGPLLRTSLLRLKRDEHVFLVTFHHIITDGWSDGVFIRELTSLYQAYCAGRPSPLAPLPVQYADYALWQRQWLQGEALQQHLDYWKKQLWRAQPLKLPLDTPRTTLKSHSGATATLRFSAELTRDLAHLSRREGVTLFMVLLSLFQILLSRLSGQTDIVVGTDVANRTQVETEGLIGFFVNLLALRTDLQGNPTFHQVAQQVRAMMLGAYSHQALPFEMVVEQVQAERQGHQDSLVQAIFVLQNMPQEEKEEIAGIRLRPSPAQQTAARFDLAMFATENKHGLWLQAVYRKELFRAETITQLLARFECLAKRAVATPEAAILSLDLSNAAEERERAGREGALYQQIGKEHWRQRRKQAIDLSQHPSKQTE
ncbi:MAG TPA: condensation domain-containing protein [Ktedonobacteraceae bacterium]|nr:condensation domain-containing protein [Ktedonobacteraceae bacterium]